VFGTAPSLTGPTTITEVVGSSGLTITGATQTASFPALSVTQIWNNSGTTFTGVKVNVTNTASAGASSVFDFQIGGATKLKMDTSGNITSASGSLTFGNLGVYSGYNMLQLSSAIPFGWSSGNAGGTSDLTMYRDAADTFAFRRLANAQTVNIYNTWTTAATNFEALRQSWISSVFHMGTTKGSSTGTARGMQFDYGGTTTQAIFVPATSGPVIIDDPKVTTGVSNDGSGFKHSRVTTGSVAAGSTVLVTVTWSTAFADANYTVMASVLDSTTTSLSLSVVHVESITASAVTVRVLNNALGALTGTLHVIAVHD
jgi:hypothetical protein